jgi:hypothetical protein
MHIFLWCTGLFLLLLALFAVFFVQGFASYMEGEKSAEMSDELQERIDYYGSVSASMLTLLMCATGGDDWKAFYDHAKELGVQYEYLFLFFLTFYHFAFFNIIVGVFCEKALNIAKPTLNELLAERYQKEFNDARQLYTLLGSHLQIQDGEGGLPKKMTSARSLQKKSLEKVRETGRIEEEHFNSFIEEPEVERFFEVRGVSPSSARRFFRLLCELRGDTSVDFPTFVSACVKLDGSASSIDMHVMSIRQLHEMHQLQKWQEVQHDELHDELKRNQRDVHQDIEQQLTQLKGHWPQSVHNDGHPSINVSDEMFDKLQISKQIGGHLIAETPKNFSPMSCMAEDTSAPGNPSKPEVLEAQAIVSQMTSIVNDLKAAQGQCTKSDVLEMQSMLSSVTSTMNELRSMQLHMQKDLKSTIGTLEQKQGSHQEEKMLTNAQEMAKLSAAFSQKAAEEAQRRAAEAVFQLETQQRLGFELQQQLNMKHHEHDRTLGTLAQVTEQSQVRERELKGLLQETSKRLEQSQMELNREILRSGTQNSKAGSAWCVGPRGSCSGRVASEQRGTLAPADTPNWSGRSPSSAADSSRVIGFSSSPDSGRVVGLSSSPDSSRVIGHNAT